VWQAAPPTCSILTRTTSFLPISDPFNGALKRLTQKQIPSNLAGIRAAFHNPSSGVNSKAELIQEMIKHYNKDEFKHLGLAQVFEAHLNHLASANPIPGL
jgi:hypothetical protein